MPTLAEGELSELTDLVVDNFQRYRLPAVPEVRFIQVLVVAVVGLGHVDHLDLVRLLLGVVRRDALLFVLVLVLVVVLDLAVLGQLAISSVAALVQFAPARVLLLPVGRRQSVPQPGKILSLETKTARLEGNEPTLNSARTSESVSLTDCPCPGAR